MRCANCNRPVSAAPEVLVWTERFFCSVWCLRAFAARRAEAEAEAVYALAD